MSLLLLALGGVAGALCRYHAAQWLQSWRLLGLPLGTLTINVSGSLLLGLLLGLLADQPHWPTEAALLLLGTGFCGAYTTFSSFAFETVGLWREHGAWRAAINLVAQPLFGISAAWLGLQLAGWLP